MQGEVGLADLRGSFSSESVAEAAAEEATYGWGIAHGGSPSAGPPPRSHPLSRSWKEKDTRACVRKSRLGWQ